MVRYDTCDHGHTCHCCGCCGICEYRVTNVNFWILHHYVCSHGHILHVWPWSHKSLPWSHKSLPWHMWTSSEIHSYSMWSSHVRMRHVIFERVMSYLKESCYVLYHVWKSHVTYEWVMNGSWQICNVADVPFVTHSYVTWLAIKATPTRACMCRVKASRHVWTSDVTHRYAIHDSFICYMTHIYV